MHSFLLIMPAFGDILRCLAALQAEGFAEVSVLAIQPGIEDTFIALMEEND